MNNKNRFTIVLIISILIAYSNTSSAYTKIKISEKIAFELSKKIPFKGTWSRKFSMGENLSQEAIYIIGDNEIQYKMEGSMPMKYTIKMNQFVAKDNRWIGKKDDIIYVIFVKNITKNSISLFKKKVETIKEALSMPFPSATSRSQFTSWNTYQKIE